MKFSRPEYWIEQPFSSPGDLPNPRIEPRSPALQADSLPAEPQGKPKNTGVGSLSHLQQIFLTQELNRGHLIAGRFFTNWAMRKAQGSLVNGHLMCCAVLSHSVVSDSLRSPSIVALQACLSMGFFRQEYWSESPCSPWSPYRPNQKWTSEPVPGKATSQ